MSITYRIFTIIAGLAVIAGGVWFGGQFLKNSNSQNNSTQTPSGTTVASDNGEKPWVEVVRGKLYLLNADGSTDKELTTGDQVKAGQTLKTDPKSRVNVYFPDGSVARMDEDTTITISEGSYDSNSNKLVVKIKLTAGSLWSKIFGLATPDSAWEVKTANSVATVRGTAFGMSYKKGKSHLAVGEHKVALTLLDPKTDELLADVKTDINEGKEIDIEDKTAEYFAFQIHKSKQENNANGPAGVEKLKTQFADIKGKLEKNITDASAAFTNEVWLKQSQEEDTGWNGKLQKLKDSGLEGKNLREKFRNTIRDQFEMQIRERIIEHQGKDVPVPGPKEETNPNTLPLNNPPSEKTPLQTALEKLVPQKLIVQTRSNLSAVIEGDKVVLEAVLVTTDGVSHVVTDSADWKVIGPIGKMIAPGVFVAGLDTNATEFGQGSGAIIASWKAPLTEKVFFDKTILFTVNAKVEAPTTTDG